MAGFAFKSRSLKTLTHSLQIKKENNEFENYEQQTKGIRKPKVVTYDERPFLGFKTRAKGRVLNISDEEEEERLGMYKELVSALDIEIKLSKEYKEKKEKERRREYMYNGIFDEIVELRTAFDEGQLVSINEEDYGLTRQEYSDKKYIEKQFNPNSEEYREKINKEYERTGIDKDDPFFELIPLNDCLKYLNYKDRMLEERIERRESRVEVIPTLLTCDLPIPRDVINFEGARHLQYYRKEDIERFIGDFDDNLNDPLYGRVGIDPEYEQAKEIQKNISYIKYQNSLGNNEAENRKALLNFNLENELINQGLMVHDSGFDVENVATDLDKLKSEKDTIELEYDNINIEKEFDNATLDKVKEELYKHGLNPMKPNFYTKVKDEAYKIKYGEYFYEKIMRYNKKIKELEINQRIGERMQERLN